MRSFAYKSLLVFVIHIALCFSATNSYAYHPFYVSVTEMTNNPKTRSLEISCKMFAEDIEDVLKQNYKTAVDLENEKAIAQNNTMLNDYMVKHLALNIDSKAMNYKFVGFEKDKESVYCYLEVINVTDVKKLSVTNTLLYDFKPEQINIVHVVINGKRQSTKLDNPQNVASFTF